MKIHLRTLKTNLLLPLAAAMIALAGQHATAQTAIAKWTFESIPPTFPTPTPGAGNPSANFLAELGTQAGVAAVSGKHIGAATYSSPSGNGSTKSLSANTWTNLNDYWQIVVNTTGFTNINLTFDAVGSSTGPKDFKVMYSTDGSTFTQFATYTVLSSPSWSSGTPQTGETYTFDLSSITTLANASTVYIRLVVNSSTAINNTTVGTGGTSRIDNLVVAGTIAGPPQIVTQPANTTVFYGDTVSLNVGAGGDAPLSYQWYTNSTPPTALTDGGNVTGTASSLLNFSFVNTNQAGNYLCIISNALNTVTSSVAQLTVNIRSPIVTNIAYIRKLHDTNFALTDTTNLYVIEGVVTTPINLVSGTTEVESYYIQDTNGYGCDVFFRGGFYMGNAGDKVRVTAPLLQFQGALELAPVNGNPAHSIELLSTGNPLPTPQFFDFTTLPTPTNMEEQLEGRYMVVSNIFIGTTNAHFNAGGTVFLTNGAAARFFATVPNNPYVDIVGYSLGGTFAKSIRGVMYQNQTSGTALTNFYSILLAQGADIEYGTPVTANPDFYSMASNTTSLFPVLTNDTIVLPLIEGSLTVSVNSSSSGVAAVDGTGTNITFTPDADYVGNVTIDYTATDSAGFTAAGVATVTVTNVPPAPATIVPTVPPAITSVTFTNGNIVITGTNAQATGVYYLLSTTNVAAALSTWTSVATNVVSTANGYTFIGTNAVTPGYQKQFYILSSTNNL